MPGLESPVPALTAEVLPVAGGSVLVHNVFVDIYPMPGCRATRLLLGAALPL